MNPVFPVIVILLAVLLWFCINSLFPVIGKWVCGIIDETKHNIKIEKDEKEEEE